MFKRISRFLNRVWRDVSQAMAASSEVAEALQRARYNVYR